MPTCNICKYAGRPTYKSPCSECKEFSEYEYENKKTNADIIRAMSDEELADVLREFATKPMQGSFLEWLQQPAKGE